MARVDLECECGYKFFVGDAQLREKGGADCPACLARVKAPGGKAPAGKAPVAKAAPRPSAPPRSDALDLEVLPAAASRTRLYVIGGIVAAVVVAAIVVVAMVAGKPAVDPAKLAELEDQARRKRFEELSSSKDGKVAPLPPIAPSKPAAPPTKPAEPVKPPKTTEFKPMPAEVKPPTQAPKTPEKAPAALPEPAARTIPSDLIVRIRSEVLTLHPFYLGLVLSPAEKLRAEAICSSGRGTPEDADFLTSLLTGAKVKAVRDEVALIAQTLPTLERESQENLPVDKITFQEGGRVMHCRILDDGVDIVKVSRVQSSGVGGQLPIRRDAILRLEKGKGIGTEFASRWDSVQKGGLASQVELLVWCKENSLAGQAKLVAFTILRGDPSNPQARTEAGLPPDPVKFAEEVAKGGVINYQGKNWNATELKEKFLKDGYHLLEGRWYSKKDKMIVVPGLFRYERQGDKPVIFGGTAPLCQEANLVYKQVQTPTGPVEQVEARPVRRFYSPQMVVGLTGAIPPGVVAPPSTMEVSIKLEVDEGQPPAGKPMKGEVTIHVPVEVPILEAAVTTTAEVKAGGSIVVYHVTGSGDNEKRTRLYTCDPKESQSHPIPTELVRGLTEVNLVAVIEQPAAYTPKTERRRAREATYRENNRKYPTSPAVDVIHYRQVPDYKAVLFPSNSNTIEVFRLRMSVAEPAPTLDKVFANNPDVLK